MACPAQLSSPHLQILAGFSRSPAFSTKHPLTQASLKPKIMILVSDSPPEMLLWKCRSTPHLAHSHWWRGRVCHMAEDGCLGQPVRRSARNLSLSLRNREKEEQWGQEGGPPCRLWCAPADSAGHVLCREGFEGWPSRWYTLEFWPWVSVILYFHYRSMTPVLGSAPDLNSSCLQLRNANSCFTLGPGLGCISDSRKATLIHLSKVLNNPCSSAWSFPASHLHRSTKPCLTHDLLPTHSEPLSISELTVAPIVSIHINCHHKILETGWLKWQTFIFSSFWRLKVQNKSASRGWLTLLWLKGCGEPSVFLSFLFQRSQL